MAKPRPKLSERLLKLLQALPELADFEVSRVKAAQGYWRQHSRGGDFTWSATLTPKDKTRGVQFVDAVDTMTDCVKHGVYVEESSGGFIAARGTKPVR